MKQNIKDLIILTVILVIIFLGRNFLLSLFQLIEPRILKSFIAIIFIGINLFLIFKGIGENIYETKRTKFSCIFSFFLTLIAMSVILSITGYCGVMMLWTTGYGAATAQKIADFLFFPWLFLPTIVFGIIANKTKNSGIMNAVILATAILLLMVFYKWNRIFI